MRPGRAVLARALASAIESRAMQQCARDLARLTGEPLAPMLRAASAPVGSVAHRALKARIDRCIEAASAERASLALWSDVVPWLERHGVPS